MRIAVFGATGVAGRAFVSHALSTGHDLVVRRADLLDPSTIGESLDGCDMAVNVATSIPKPGGRGDWATNDRIRVEGTANLLDACISKGVGVLVQQSVAMLHSASDHREQVEDDPLVATSILASAVAMEMVCKSSGLDVRLVRGGLFYGPGTGSLERWLTEVARPDFRIPGDGSAWLSPVHVEDYARALLTVAGAGSPNGTYIACDDNPIRWDDLYSHLSSHHGLSKPSTGGPLALRSFRVNNYRLRQLGWLPRNSLLTSCSNLNENQNDHKNLARMD